jgi:hypothetical protein
MTKLIKERSTRKGMWEGSYIDEAGVTRYKGRLRLADGTKSSVICIDMQYPKGCTEKQARASLAELQAAEDEHRIHHAKKLEGVRVEAAESLRPAVGEASDAWHRRFLASAVRSEYHDSNVEAARIWRKWIAPHIGNIPMAHVASDDIERVRDGLDDAIRATAIGAKTAQNIWSVLTTAFKAARNAKQRDLRVRTDNPCTYILPPEDGPRRRSTGFGQRKQPRFSYAPKFPLNGVERTRSLRTAGYAPKRAPKFAGRISTLLPTRSTSAASGAGTPSASSCRSRKPASGTFRSKRNSCQYSTA